MKVFSLEHARLPTKGKDLKTEVAAGTEEGGEECEKSK